MAITKIQSNAFPTTIDLSNVDLTLGAGEVLTANIADGNVTHAKLHTDMDLSSKTVTLPSAITDTISNKLPLAGGTLTGPLTVQGNGNATMQWGDTTAIGALSFDASDNPLIRSYTGKDLFFQTNGGNNRMVILSNGNVGIGTFSPNNALRVVASASQATSDGAVVLKNEMNNGYETLKLETNNDRDSILSFRSTGTNSYWWGMGIDNSDGGKFKMGADNLLGVNNRFVITQSGNVGIGTSSPSARLDVNGLIKGIAGAGSSGGIKLHVNSGINISANVMSFHTGQTGGFKFNNNSDGADDNNTIVHITAAGNLIQNASYYNTRAIPEVYELEPYTINVGGYKRSWVKLCQFSAGGQQEIQFRIHYQGDHNYNHLFLCQGQVHQWSASTGNVNFYIKGLGGNLTGEFVFSADHSIWWKPSGLWSDTGRFEVLSKTSGCTIMTDISNNLADGTNPGGTIYSFSNTGETSGEINWGA